MLQFLLLNDSQYFLLLGEEELLIYGAIPEYAKIERAVKRGRKIARTEESEISLKRIKSAIAQIESQSVRVPHIRKLISMFEAALDSPKVGPHKTNRKESVANPIPISDVKQALTRVLAEIRNALLIIILADE